MNRRARLLAGGAVPAIVLGAVAALPSASPLGDAVLTLTALCAAAVLWVVGGGSGRRTHGWRLLAAALLFPVVRTAVEAAVRPTGEAALVLHWAPTIPGYALAVGGALSFLDLARLREAGARILVELALFTGACLLAAELIVLGPGATRWSVLDAPEKWAVGGAMGAIAAVMATALALVGAIEPRRRRTALTLLAGSLLMTAGGSLVMASGLGGALGAPGLGRPLVAAGLMALALAAVTDPGAGPEPADRCAGRRGCSAVAAQLLPHAAMMTSVLLAGVIYAEGRRTSLLTVVAVVVCAVLCGVHRILSLREERRMAGRLARSEAWFRALVGAGADSVLALDEELRISWVSPSLDRVLGAGAAGALVGRPLLGAVHPDDVEALVAALPAVPGPDAPADGAEGGPASAEGSLPVLRLRADDGGWRSLEAGVRDLRGHPDVGAVVLHCRDMTERLAREQALRDVAYTDPGTGLLNSAGWLRALQQAAEAAAVPAGTDGDDAGDPGPTHDDPSSAVLLLQLDGLTEVREHTGREVVSAVVAELGRRLRATVRGEDLVARLGGGGYAVLAAGTPDEADRLAARCLAVVEQPIVTPQGVLDLTASVGVAPVEPGTSGDELQGRAELAVRAARAAGPGRSARYSPVLGEAAARRDRLRADLEGAVARGELSLVLQPVVSLRDQRVTGLEALLRWRHPELGEVLPAEFVPIAERAGLIGGLQRWVLAEATGAIAALPAGDHPVRVCVNLSTAYLTGGTVVADVEAALRSSGLTPERLVLEVTEDAVCSEQRSVALDVETLRLMGVHVALDDFGTGRSALASLSRLPLDVLKLDGALTTRIDRDRHALALCRSIVTIAHALGLTVVAEEVETPAQLSSLCGIGCDSAQGFLLARPMDRAGLGGLLRESGGQLWPGLVGSR